MKGETMSKVGSDECVDFRPWLGLAQNSVRPALITSLRFDNLLCKP